MNSREKILAILAFTATGIMLLAFIATKLILNPTTAAREQARKVVIDIDKVESKIRMEGYYRESLGDAAQRSYGRDASVATEMLRAHLVRMVINSGLAPDELGLTPVTGKAVKGGREVGWSIRIKGPLDRLTNFLYVVNEDPHLHRLDTITWTPIANQTDLTLSARFVTLVLDPLEETFEPLSPSEAGGLARAGSVRLSRIVAALPPPPIRKEVDLRSNDRLAYALISDRDIFRPYIKRPPPPPTPTRPTVVRTDPQPTRTETPPSSSPSYQLVGLPTWGDVSEVIVKDTRGTKSKTYKIGEDLIGGEIVMVDYRPLPLPKKPQVYSSSRVIVRVGRDYWAVELGQFLTDKYLLTGERLPESLKGSQPAKTTPLPGKTPGEVDVIKPQRSDSTSTATSPEPESVPVSQEAGHAP